MTPDRYRQAELLFNQALEVTPDRRENFLTEACGTDDELRQEIDSLLSAHSHDGGFLDAPPISAALRALARLDGSPVVGGAVGHYRIVGLLGKGGMGDVYLAEDTRLDRRVALKLLPPLFTGDSERLRRFIKEAKAASSLNHPNIITIHEIGEEAGSHYIATEYVEGQTLRRLVGSLDLGEAMEIAIQVAGALSAAHQSGIIHRDIKPENIMVRPDGLIKVLDFGIAKLTMKNEPAAAEKMQEKGSVKTEPGVVIGTLQYMSPEQTRGVEVDARTDLFSFGVVLYELISGKAPFDGETQSDCIAAILTREASPMKEGNKDIPSELDRIVAKALQKKREERYQNAKELLIDLKNLRQEMEIAARLKRSTDKIRVGRTTGAMGPARESLRMQTVQTTDWNTLILGGVAALAIGALLWWYARRIDGRSTGLLSSFAPVAGYDQKGLLDEAPPNASLSPDGRMLAFSRNFGHGGQICVSLIGQRDPLELTTEPTENTNPIWSPDGLELAYLSRAGRQIVVRRIPALGGSSRMIATLPTGSGSIPILRRWSKNGGLLYYEQNHNLYSLDIARGTTTQATQFGSLHGFPFDFDLSPNEDRIVYVAHREGQSDLWESSLKGDDAVRLTADAAEERRPVFHPDGERIFFSADRNGILQGCFLRRVARRPIQFTAGDEQSQVLDLSSDGKKVVSSSVRRESDLWGVNVETGEEFLVTASPGVEHAASPSPDGNSLAYQFQSASHSDSGGGDVIEPASLRIMGLHPSGVQSELTTNGGSPAWSPGSRRIAFLRRLSDKIELWTALSAGSDERRATDRPLEDFGRLDPASSRANLIPGFTPSFQWSPTGDRLAFVWNLAGGSGLGVAAPEGGGDRTILEDAKAERWFQSPHWSTDGSQIAILSVRNDGGRELWALQLIEASSGGVRTIAESEQRLLLLGWAGQTDLMALRETGTAGSSEAQLLKVSVTDGREQALAGVSLCHFDGRRIRLSPDGQRVAFVSRADAKENVWMLSPGRGKARRLTINNDPTLSLAGLTWSHDQKTLYFSKHQLWRRLNVISNLPD
jgi:serine/threonine protein kinase/Tol biopolymer transport system component